MAMLDWQRLGAQRGHEGIILAKGALARLNGQTYGWQQHPASLMWKGHEYALMTYLVYAAREWRRRGYHDECLPQYLAIREQLDGRVESRWPDWWGSHPIHERHRTWLLLRRWQHYAPLPEFADVVDYAWDYMHRRRDVDEEPTLVWPVSGIVSASEGPSPGERTAL